MRVSDGLGSTSFQPVQSRPSLGLREVKRVQENGKSVSMLTLSQWQTQESRAGHCEALVFHHHQMFGPAPVVRGQ